MRCFVQWPAVHAGDSIGDESALIFDEARPARLLVLPALFDEANKLRRLTVGVMDRLDRAGIDSFLPDLPGTNDSLAPLSRQTLESWRAAAEATARHFAASHVLTVRAGALLAPAGLPGWRYAPAGGARQMRAMLRARTIAAREAGREETMAGLQQSGERDGIELAGWQLGAEMFAALASAPAPEAGALAEIAQETIGGTGLWLRAEPDHDPAQADALAAVIAVALSDAGGAA